MTWRERMRPHINEVITKRNSRDVKVIRAELRKVYPFGSQKGWLLKIWHSEINNQLGKLGIIEKKRKPEVETPLFYEK